MSGEMLSWDKETPTPDVWKEAVGDVAFGPEAVGEKRERLKSLDTLLRDKVKDQIEAVPEDSPWYPEGNVYIDEVFCGACFEAGRDKTRPYEEQMPSLRKKACAEAKIVQDFMFLEESRAWLPEGCEAEKRLTELFHKTYCEDESGDEAKEPDIDQMLSSEHDLHKATEKAQMELSPRLQEFDEAAKPETPRLYSDKDYEEESSSIDVRRRDFVAFARARLGEDSEEYRLILAEVYKPGYVTDDAKDKSVGSEHYMLQDKLIDYRAVKERAPILSYLTGRDISKLSGGVGYYMPLRFSRSLVRFEE